jgi:PAS domain S-box-containing protein
MNPTVSNTVAVADATSARVTELFKEQQQNIIRHTDRLFSWLMICQWFFAIGLALWISPRTWSGVDSRIHPHVWLAIFLGGIITSVPVFLARKQPGKTLTRHVVAVGQMLMSGLLIHLTGGRIETHFHVFGSLAILAFYRDWRVLISATTVVYLDHIIRGIFWPESVYGVLYASIWRSFEHAGWVMFEVTFLIIAIRKSLSEMLLVAERQAKLENLNETIEYTVTERTAALTNEITEREKAEQALRESQALYYTLVEQLPAGVFRKDSEGRYVLVNSWFCHLRGKTPNELLRKKPAELAALETETHAAARLLIQGAKHHEQIMRTGQPMVMEEQYPGADGKTLYFHVMKSPVFGPDGRVIGSQGILMDVTEAKRAEAELNFERNLLRALMDKTDDGIYFKDLKSRFIRSSESMARRFGLQSAGELVGKHDGDFFSDEHAKEAFKDEQTIMRTGEPILGKVEKETWPDGHVTWALSSKIPFRNVQGEIIGTIGISKDITGLKHTQEALRLSEEQLRQSQKMEAVGRLAGGVAHDFNNMLTVINGYCGMALQKKEEVQPIRKNIEEILKAADRASSLTNQLLAFSRKQVLQPRVLQLNEVVRGMEKMLRRMIGEDVELSTTFDSALGNVKADPGQIEQVIMNLAVNARDAMPRGGKLTISTANATIDQKTKFRNRTLETGEYVMLAISDNGVGMTDDVKAHLFEPFFTTKGLGKGTGLGLATCHGIICQSGGDIRVYSEPNSGTTFRIYLPRTDATLEPVATEDLENLPAGTETILVVEDDPSVRELAVIILRNCGYQVQESHNAFEALALIKRNPQFDLVVTDVIMPQMSGKELYEQIKSDLPQIKVLLMSGYTDDALAHHGVLDEGLFFLEKPFSPAKLARKVRETLDVPDVPPAVLPKQP